MNIIKNFSHQGDLNFRRVKEIPKGAKKINLYKSSVGGDVLALGEHTNHQHVLVKERPETKIAVKEFEGRRYISIRGGNAKLLHGTFTAPAKVDEQETDKHDWQVFTPGIYEQDFEIEYDPFAKKINQVID